jgi:hypothetical protein
MDKSAVGREFESGNIESVLPISPHRFAAMALSPLFDMDIVVGWRLEWTGYRRCSVNFMQVITARGVQRGLSLSQTLTLHGEE